jgi:MFS family permease
MLDLALFRSRVFTAAGTAAVLNFMTQYVMVFLTPFLLQQVLGDSAERAGLILTAFPLTILVVGPFSGSLSDRAGHRGLASAGLVACTVSGVLFARISGDVSTLSVVLYLSLFGLGSGLFISPNNSAIMGSVPRHRLGIAGSILATARNTGMVLGIMTGGAVLTAGQAAHGGSFIAGLTDANGVAAVLSLAGALIALLAKEREGLRPEDVPARG